MPHHDTTKCSSNDIEQTTDQLAHLALTDEEDGIVMATFSAVGKNPKNGKTVKLFVYLDAGARFTCISRQASEALGLKPIKEAMLQTARFNTSHVEKVNAEVVTLELSTEKGHNMPMTAYHIANLAPMLTVHPVRFTRRGWEVLKKYNPVNVPPRFSIQNQIDVLVGMDYYYAIMGPKVAKTIPIEGNVVVHVTPMGNIIAGNTLQTSKVQQCTSTIPALLSYTVTEDIPYLWKLDTIGIREPNESTVNNKWQEQLSYFKETTQFKEGRYYARWPWKTGNPTLPTNFYTARYRLQKTLDTLQLTEVKTKEFELYNDIIQDQLKKKIIEPVDSKKLTNNLVHYIAHFPVIRKQSETTKVRIVYDASAKTKPTGLCLNDLIYKGANYLEDIAGLLLRFRIPKIALISDRENSFLQVGLQESDRDTTRFLWLRDTQQATTQGNLQIYRFTRIPFGIVASPFLLGATIDLHLELNPGPIADLMRRNIYMDNIFIAASSSEEALDLYKQGKDLFNRASMNLREWISNDQRFNSSIPAEDRIQNAVTKVLGLTWNTITDKLSIRVPQTPIQPVNKRMILHQVAKIYDPLGFLNPISIRGRLLIQKLWLDSKDWDDEINKEYEDSYRRIEQDVLKSAQIELARFSNVNTDEPIQLHCFTDASLKAYATVVYVRQERNGSALVSSVMSKARVAPIKPNMTLPKLELMVVLIGCRLLRFVEAELRLSVERRYLWTDSEIVLHWIFSRKPLGMSISKKVEEISLTGDIDFNYVPSKENSADIATRSSTYEELLSSRWFPGPVWLGQKQDLWPKKSFGDPVYYSAGTKKVLSAAKKDEAMLQQCIQSTPQPIYPFQIEISRFSSLTNVEWRIHRPSTQALFPDTTLAHDMGVEWMDKTCLTAGIVAHLRN